MTRTGRALLLLATLAVVGCGKKGAPLPPLVRVPGAVLEPTALRVEDQVFVRFAVPTANVDGHAPADISRVEVYAITLDRAPTVEDDPVKLRRLSKLIGTEPVRRPLPPIPPSLPGEPARPPLPPGPGVDQGDIVVVHETLTPDTRVAAPLPDRVRRPGKKIESDIEPLPGPLVAPLELNEPIRYYYAVGVSPGGRYGLIQLFVPMPLGTTSGAPGQPELKYDESTLTIHWTPPADARGVGPEPIPDALPSTPTVPGPPATTYDVYEVRPANETPPMPTALTDAPVGGVELSQPVGAFGTERCFFVRSVDILQGYHVRGPASPTACVTLTDTFPPKPPKSLAAVATEGAINLIWEPSESADLVGYLVLRSRLPDDTLQPATPEPITGTTFVDKGVRPGVTYGYVVVAVDKAGNRSEQSNRVEETARQ